MSRFSTHEFRMAAGFVVLLLIGPAIIPLVRGAAPQQAADQQTVLSSRTDLVALPVTVTDAHGNFVLGLTAGDFTVLEDGQPQKITFFERQDTPVTVGLIVDHSGSMASKLNAVAAAVLSFARSSRPEDEMFVVDFADAVSVELLHGKPFTSDSEELRGAVLAISASGQTALYDALAEGFLHLQLGRWNKRALIVVSDGGDNVSQHTFPQILAEARSSHTVIYAIGLLGESGREENPGVLRRLCRETGGIAFFPQEGASIADVSMKIARDLREQYMIGYPPPARADTAAFRKIEVRVSVPGQGSLRVRTRAGYSVTGGSASESARSAR